MYKNNADLYVPMYMFTFKCTIFVEYISHFITTLEELSMTSSSKLTAIALVAGLLFS
jgi:hypothetical protein